MIPDSTTGAAVQQIIQYIRHISAAQFAGIALLFFLPFLEVSCSNYFVIEISGQQFATGGKVTVPNMPNTGTTAPTVAPGVPVPGSPNATPNQQAPKDIEPHLSAILAWIAAIAGVVVSLMAGRIFRIVCAALGGVGAAMLLWLKSEVMGDMGPDAAQVQAFIQINWKFAFWACVILFITAAGTNIYVLMRPPNAGPRP